MTSSACVSNSGPSSAVGGAFHLVRSVDGAIAFRALKGMAMRNLELTSPFRYSAGSLIRFGRRTMNDNNPYAEEDDASNGTP